MFFSNTMLCFCVCPSVTYKFKSGLTSSLKVYLTEDNYKGG